MILTLVLAGNSNAFLVFLQFVGPKGQYTSKLLFGWMNNPGNRLLEKFYVDYIFLKIFFYRSKALVAKNAKKRFCSKKMATKSKTGVETPKKFFLS